MKSVTRILGLSVAVALASPSGIKAQVAFPQNDSVSSVTAVDSSVNENTASELTNNTEISKKRIRPMVYYSNPDRIFAGVKFTLAQGTFGYRPTGYEQSLQLRYSISQNAFSILYDGNFYRMFGDWNAAVNAYYDWVVWTNYFGLGNDTKIIRPLTDYRISTGEYALNLGINRLINRYHYVELTAYGQGIEVFNNSGSFVRENAIGDGQYFSEHRLFVGIKGGYTYQRVDDYILPQRGVMLYGGLGYTFNTYNSTRSFANYSGIAQVYIPLPAKLNLSIRAGASGIIGSPEFFQYVSTGGPLTIRGYRRDRFWGDLAFYNSNELRYITDIRIKKYTGKIGPVVFFDDGRVWARNQSSTTLHYGYGGGLFVSPMHLFTAYATYGVSPEGGLLQFKVTKLLGKIPPTRSRQVKE
ncbi:MAG: BamA/TamA family outer membrane protein [Bacteroidetes bacterium]|nr:BamA/TamA family outer membrane protein [Bacteroidota bacterium]